MKIFSFLSDEKFCCSHACVTYEKYDIYKYETHKFISRICIFINKILFLFIYLMLDKISRNEFSILRTKHALHL
jgi:hypothetical protein